MHIGSQITDLAPFDNATALMAELARDLMGEGHPLHHMDLGGGLGVPYREDEEPPPAPSVFAEGRQAAHPGSRAEAAVRDRPHDRRPKPASLGFTRSST